MKTVILMASAALYFCIISESRAEIIDSGTCGTNCNWALDDKGNMKITGGSDGKIGTMDNYRSGLDEDGVYYSTSPWFLYGNAGKIKNVNISGIDNVGRGAFRNFPSMESVSLSDTITTIGEDAFWNNNINNLILPDSLLIVENGAFSWNSLNNLELSDSITSLGLQKGNNHLKNLICKGSLDKCTTIYEQIKSFGLNPSFSLAGESDCESKFYYWSGLSCNNKKDGIKCAENWKQNEDFCNRIRYTPAEAAKVLKNDNTNKIVITFKK